MPDVREYQSVVEEAERAARAGDFARADGLLREALALQEAALGPSHPELASTLNNLAVVCETTGHIEDAERFYRRAYAVASATLPPTDPLVETSRENLKDFCAARGLLLDEWPGIGDPATPAPAAVSPVAAAPPPPPVSAPGDPPARPSAAPFGASRPSPPAGPAAKGWPGRLVAMVALLAVVGVLAVTRSWWPATVDRPAETAAAPSPASTSGASSPASSPTASSPTASSPAASSPVAAGAPAPAARTSPPAPAAAPAAAARPPAAPPPRSGAAPAGVRVLVADVCRTLTRSGAWRCDPLGSPAAPGPASFYTRLASPRAMRVQHRWYQGTTLRQSVTLSIAANPTAGYRTFSRQTLAPGAWRVELRGADGAVLHTSSFEVR